MQITYIFGLILFPVTTVIDFLSLSCCTRFFSSFFSVLFLCFAFEAAITVCPAIYVTCNWNQPRLQHISWPRLNVQGFQQINKETMDRKKGREINPVACADESERARLFV